MPKKRTIIFGAGQCGIAVKALLNNNFDVVGFVDNNNLIVGTELEGIKVYSPSEILKIDPNIVFIAVMGEDRCKQITNQLLDLGVKSEIIDCITYAKETFDVRIASLHWIANEIKAVDVKGEVAELGVYKGDFSVEINKEFHDRRIFLFDTFEGFKKEDIKIEEYNKFSKACEGDYSDTDENFVLNRLKYPQMAVVKKGYFPETAKNLEEKYAFVSIDADLYKPVYEGLVYFYPRMSVGGYILIHDYNNMQYKGAGKAVREYCKENHIGVVPLCDIHGSAVIVKG